MNVKDLQKKKKYYYTAGCEYIEVIYTGKTKDGYCFTANGVTNSLNEQSVNLYIEEK
jgi:hypothetical protein